MATRVASLYASLTADSASFVSNMKRAATATEQTASSIQKGLKAAKIATEAFLALAVVNKLVESAKSASDYASSLGETSEQLGFTSKGLQELRYAATQSGASIESADKALGKFSVSVGKAREGNKQLRDAFAAVGISASDLSKLGTEQLFAKVADGLAAIPDPARRAAAEVALFGKGGQALGVVLNSGSAGIAAFADQAERLGIVVSDRAIKNLDDLNDSGDRLKLAFNAQLANLIGENTGAIIALGEAAASAIGKITALINQAKGIGFLSDRGNRLGAFSTSAADQIKLGTPQGQKAYDNQNVANIEQQIANEKKGANYAGRIYYLQNQLKAARGFQKQSSDAALDDLNNVFALPSAKPAANNFQVDGVNDGSAEAAARKAEAAARKAQAEAERAAARIQTLKDQLASVNADITRGAIELAATPETRLSLEIDAAEEETRKRIEKVLGDGSKDKTSEARALTAAAADRLRDQGAQEVEIIRTNYQRQNEEALAQLTDGNKQIALQSKSANADLILDYRDRAAAQIAIIREQVDQSIAEIQREIDTSTSLTAGQKSALVARQQALRAGGDAQIAGVKAGAKSPLQQFADTLPDTENKLNDAFQNVAIDGLKSLNDGLADAIVNSKSLGDVFSNVAKSIVADLIKIAIQKAIIGPITGALGGLFGGLFGAGHANGGGVEAGTVYPVGERGPELFRPGTSGTIIPNHALKGSNDNGQRVAVDVNVSPSPLFITAVATTSQQAGQQAAQRFADQRSRRPIPRSRSA